MPVYREPTSSFGIDVIQIYFLLKYILFLRDRSEKKESLTIITLSANSSRSVRTCLPASTNHAQVAASRNTKRKATRRQCNLHRNSESEVHWRTSVRMVLSQKYIIWFYIIFWSYTNRLQLGGCNQQNHVTLCTWRLIMDCNYIHSDQQKLFVYASQTHKKLTKQRKTILTSFKWVRIYLLIWQ